MHLLALDARSKEGGDGGSVRQISLLRIRQNGRPVRRMGLDVGSVCPSFRGGRYGVGRVYEPGQRALW